MPSCYKKKQDCLNMVSKIEGFTYKNKCYCACAF